MKHILSCHFADDNFNADIDIKVDSGGIPDYRIVGGELNLGQGVVGSRRGKKVHADVRFFVRKCWARKSVAILAMKLTKRKSLHARFLARAPRISVRGQHGYNTTTDSDQFL